MTGLVEKSSREARVRALLDVFRFSKKSNNGGGARIVVARKKEHTKVQQSIQGYIRECKVREDLV